MTSHVQRSQHAKFIFGDMEFHTLPSGKLFPRQLALVDLERPEGDNFFRAYVQHPNKNNSSRTDEFTGRAPTIQERPFSEVWPRALEWMKEGLEERRVITIWHNAWGEKDSKTREKKSEGDWTILQNAVNKINSTIPQYISSFCTLYLSGCVHGRSGPRSLQALREHYNIEFIGAHEALLDAEILRQVFLKMVGDVNWDKLAEAMLKPKHESPVKSVAKLINQKVPILFVYDTETTGLLEEHGGSHPPRFVELAAATPTKPGQEAWGAWMINPAMPIPKEASNVHGILNERVADEPEFSAIGPEFKKWVADALPPNGVAILLGHNVWGFDDKVLSSEFERYGMRKWDSNWRSFDTLWISRSLFKGRKKERGFHKLQNLRAYWKIPETDNAHRAYDDVYVNYQVFLRMCGIAEDDLSLPENQKKMNAILKMVFEPHPVIAVANKIRELNPGMYDESIEPAEFLQNRLRTSKVVPVVLDDRGAKRRRVVSDSDDEVERVVKRRHEKNEASQQRIISLVDYSSDEEDVVVYEKKNVNEG